MSTKKPREAQRVWLVVTETGWATRFETVRKAALHNRDLMNGWKDGNTYRVAEMREVLPKKGSAPLRK